jgi:phenylpropionate dioxygenase-like ring-hydroxylating dioxygenase large terminal subunit
VPDECVLACVQAIEHVIKKHGLVIDAGDEIFDEYRDQLSMKGQPGQGDRFMKWVHDNRWSLPASQRVVITNNGDSYDEFPSHEGLGNFDRSDRKFVAVANAHPQKPPILQATDSKWWAWRDALAQVGIAVHFLCPDYVRNKYADKKRS